VASLDNIPIDVSIVKDKLSNLDPGKATGPDGVSPRVLKRKQQLSYVYPYP